MNTATRSTASVVPASFVNDQVSQARKSTGVTVNATPDLVRAWNANLELIFSAFRIGTSWHFSYNPKFYEQAAA